MITLPSRPALASPRGRYTSLTSLSPQVPTTRATLAVVAIGMGCVLSSYGEGQFSLVGVGFRSLGIFSEATRLVLTQKLLKHHKLNIIESQASTSPSPAFPHHTARGRTRPSPMSQRHGLLLLHTLAERAQYYLAPIGAGFLLVGATFSELPRAMRSDALSTVPASPCISANYLGEFIRASRRISRRCRCSITHGHSSLRRLLVSPPRS